MNNFEDLEKAMPNILNINKDKFILNIGRGDNPIHVLIDREDSLPVSDSVESRSVSNLVKSRPSNSKSLSRRFGSFLLDQLIVKLISKLFENLLGKVKKTKLKLQQEEPKPNFSGDSLETNTNLTNDSSLYLNSFNIYLFFDFFKQFFFR